MEMIRLVAVLLAIVITMAPLGSGIPDQNPEAVEKWFEKLPHAEPTVSKLRFYLHNIFSGDNSTIAQVAQANVTSPTNFGTVIVIDAPLTVRPDLDSELVGFAQGLYIYASQEEVAAVVDLNFVFTGGEYNGSTLSLLGDRPVDDQYREYPIVGGSGDLRLARGVGTVQTYYQDTLSETLQFDFIFVHY